MSRIRVLSDQIANQIAAGEVVERPASVAKELVENSIDAGARRVEIDVDAGGRRLLRVSDDGEGMSHDDAVLAFERHATSKIISAEDLTRIRTLGFRGEALASIASVARVELITQAEGEPSATRVLIEGGRMRDVGPAARPRGTTISVRDLFFNVPARRKFLRSEATESFHLTNIVTHYALAQPETAFVLTNNGRETLRAAPAADLRERAYQIFGADFIENLLEVSGGLEHLARVRGYVSAPRERRTSRDAQYLFVNGRFVRDRLIGRALSEAFRSVLPQGAFPAALLFLEVAPEELDVNVHPAKTEVRFRRAAAVSDAVREAVRAALRSGGYVRASDDIHESKQFQSEERGPTGFGRPAPAWVTRPEDVSRDTHAPPPHEPDAVDLPGEERAFFESLERAAASPPRQAKIGFDFMPPADDGVSFREEGPSPPAPITPEDVPDENARSLRAVPTELERDFAPHFEERQTESQRPRASEMPSAGDSVRSVGALPPLTSVAGLVREVPVESLSNDIRPLGQLEESFIVATDAEGLLLIDQHVAHERILFDKYRALEASRPAESQNLLMPETFDLTPAEATVFDSVAEELESYGFGLMRLSGRTVAIRAVPADLPAGEARGLLAEVLSTVDASRRGARRASFRDEIAAALACRAAVKVNTPLTERKMRWLIDRLLVTSSPTTCPHGRPVILRLATRDIEKGFHRT